MVSVSFGRTLYPVSEGEVALLEVILSTPSIENVSVDIVTMDSLAEGHSSVCNSLLPVHSQLQHFTLELTTLFYVFL